MSGKRTPEQVAEARAWIKECVGDPENVNLAGDHLIDRYMQRHYPGGWDAFLADTVVPS